MSGAMPVQKAEEEEDDLPRPPRYSRRQHMADTRRSRGQWNDNGLVMFWQEY